MTSYPLISIIVPVYNTEKYLCKCVDSILVQTYTNLEVILIDDGSSDNCPVICDEYASKDSRVVVIHQKNSGVSAARNAGLDIARGEYIGFVDSDDWIEPDMYEVLFSLFLKYNIEIAHIDSCYFYEGETKNAWRTEKSCVITRDNALQMLCIPSYKGCDTGLWSKLFKAELFSDIRLDTNITIFEDALACAQLIAKSEHIAYTEYHCYHYFQRSSSAFHNYKESCWSIQKASQAIFDLYSKVCPENMEFAEYVWMSYDFWLLKLMAENDALTKERFRKVMDHMKIHYSRAAFEKFRFGHKIGLFSAKMGRIPFKIAYGVYLATVGRKNKK